MYQKAPSGRGVPDQKIRLKRSKFDRFSQKSQRKRAGLFLFAAQSAYLGDGV
jgi:hypothetical protein